MKKIFFLSLFLALLSLTVTAQSYTPIAGKFQYQFMKIDSLAMLPGGNTATRKPASSARYAVRYNTDSSAFEYSDGTRWWTFAIKAAGDFIISEMVPAPEIRDTTISMSCFLYPGGITVNIPYLHYKIPQFIGFRVRVTSLAQSFDEGPETYCLYQNPFIVWNSQTGDLFILGGGDTPGELIYYRVSSY